MKDYEFSYITGIDIPKLWVVSVVSVTLLWVTSNVHGLFVVNFRSILNYSLFLSLDRKYRTRFILQLASFFSSRRNSDERTRIYNLSRGCFSTKLPKNSEQFGLKYWAAEWNFDTRMIQAFSIFFWKKVSQVDHPGMAQDILSETGMAYRGAR